MNGSKVKQRWSLYMLECSDGTLYTGITNDLPRRLAQHNSGRASRYTRGRLPVKLVHAKPCKDRSQALKREYALKRLSRNEKIASLQKSCVTGTFAGSGNPVLRRAERVKKGNRTTG